MLFAVAYLWLYIGDPFVQVCNNFQPQFFLGDRIFNPYPAHYFFTAFVKEYNFMVKI
jgi:hypothetical protein